MSSRPRELHRGLAFAGWVLAFLVGSVLRIRRAHVVRSMRAAGIASPGRVATRMYRALGRGVSELVALLIRRPPTLADWVKLDSPELVPFIEPRPRGAVLAVSHTGNWDLVACAVAERTPLTVITKRLSVGWLDRVWQNLRKSRGVRLVQAGGAWRSAIDALGRSELVAMLIDQAPERQRGATRTVFLGQTAWVDLAPALVAMRAGVPLVGAFPKRFSDGTLGVEIGPVLEPPPRSSRAWAEGAMHELTRALDAFVRNNPEQWLWMHRRWKSPGEVAGAARQGRGVGCAPRRCQFPVA